MKVQKAISKLKEFVTKNCISTPNTPIADTSNDSKVRSPEAITNNIEIQTHHKRIHTHTKTMKTYQTIIVLFALVLSAANAFTMTGSQMGSSFVVSQRARPSPKTASSSPRTGVSSLHMGGKAQFGVFSPAVYAAKIVLGDGRLKKYRGKAISIHSSTIGDFCQWCVIFPRACFVYTE